MDSIYDKLQVVIRFQICIFDILNTALAVWDIDKVQL